MQTRVIVFIYYDVNHYYGSTYIHVHASPRLTHTHMHPHT